MFTILNACVYHIWRVRNEVLWSQKVWIVENTIQNIKSDVYNRVNVVLPTKMTRRDREWIENLCMKR